MARPWPARHTVPARNGLARSRVVMVQRTAARLSLANRENPHSTASFPGTGVGTPLAPHHLLTDADRR